MHLLFKIIGIIIYIFYFVLFSESRKEFIKIEEYEELRKKLKAENIKSSEELNDYVKRMNEIMVKPIIINK